MSSVQDTVNALALSANEQRDLANLLAGKGYIPLPLNSFREATAFDVANIVANGGVLASDTTPLLEGINGATDGCQRLVWAASNGDQIVTSFSLPKDLDAGQPLKLYFTIASGGTTNAVGFTLATFFDEGDTSVADTSGTNQTVTYTEVTATIAASDIPTGARNMTLGLTPVAHTTDTLILTGGVLVEYTKSLSANISR